MLILTSSLIAVASVPAEEGVPKGQPPAMVRAKVGEVGNLTISRVVLVPEQRTEIRKVPVIELRTEIVGGKAVTGAVTVEKEVPVVTTHYAEVVQESDVAKTGFQVRDLDGKKVEGETLAKTLAKLKPVLLVSGAKELDPFYAGFFKPGTLVVFLDEPGDTTPRAVPLPAVGGPKLPFPAIKPLPAAPSPPPKSPPPLPPPE